MPEGNMRLCEKDGFPKVQIQGHWECVAEYLDRCIGGQRVIDVVQRGDTVYYVFENGHELPMLCFCCGEPLGFYDLDKSRLDMKGRRLERMSLEPGLLEDGAEMLQFRLHYSKKGLFSKPIVDPISVEAAAKMKHPPGCPYVRPSTPSGQRSGQRKKRRPTERSR